MIKNEQPRRDEVCPLCKMLVDEPGAYDNYRKGDEYKAGKYPRWAYYTHGAESEYPLPYHLSDYHRLPESLANSIAVAKALGKIFKDLPPTVSIMIPKPS